jgi:peptidyl-prolyl cis-trans isomerase B (cyclophilin B)
MKKNLLVISLIVILAMALALTGCGKKNTVDTSETTSDFTSTQLSGNAEENQDIEGENEMSNVETINPYLDIEKNPVVTMEIEGVGTIKMELYPQIAPESVENFISLINRGFYNGLVFHRVIPEFMAQGGDPNGNGTGGAEYNIVGEFAANGVKNDLSHTRGVLSMARANDPNSASSQFFIVTTDSTYLDGNYAAFGKVLEGMDVVDTVVNSPVIRRSQDVDKMLYYTNPEEYYTQMSEADRPVNPPVIKSATVETFDVEYAEPTKLK